MELPRNERRTIDKLSKKKIWVYGCPFSGKSTLANSFPDPLFLNTDGNTNSFDAPVVPIKDEVTLKGRITERKLAWKVFKDTIEELEKKDNSFKTIVVELVEDLYEQCRVYCYDKLGIEHESDNSFKAWDYVRNEYLNTVKRLMNLDYENIVLESHEDTTKDITKKTGDKVTTIKPNVNDKIALKLAGMVDVVCRIVVDGDKRSLSFKTDEVVFGGGRLEIKNVEIPLTYEALMSVYEKANHSKTQKVVATPKVEVKPVATPIVEETAEEETAEEETEQTEETVVEEQQPTPVQPTEEVARTRSRRIRA